MAEKNDNFQRDLELYKIAVENFRYEGQVRWLVFGPFLLIHTGLAGFIANRILENNLFCAKVWPLLIACLIGILLGFLWLATFNRINTYYFHRMYLAKKSEEKLSKHNKINDWYFLNGNSNRLSAGGEDTIKVEKDSKTFKMSGLSQKLGSKKGILAVIWIFIVIYILFIVYILI